MDADLRQVHDFITRWEQSTLNEESGSQSHFNELCELFGIDPPTKADPEGKTFKFETKVTKIGGKSGWADVWKKESFAWEYKSPGEDLDRAFRQLKEYAGYLENPPLLVVSDMKRFIIATNWTNTPQRMFEFTIQDLEDPEKLGWLEAVFREPKRLHPNVYADKLTEEAAKDFARLSEALGDTPEVAHFLIQIAFCLFAEDMGLLPSGGNGGSGFLTWIIQECQDDRVGDFADAVRQLFRMMAQGGKDYTRSFRHFNGGLFEGGEYFVPPLNADHIATLLTVARRDWSGIEPSIFGTLFERGLDKSKRKQLGAHYTSREDIEALVKPVLMAQLEREWAVLQEKLEQIPTPRIPVRKPQPHPSDYKQVSMDDEELVNEEIEPDPNMQVLMEVRDNFLTELRTIRVLDPACGSGNFLYVSLTLLKDLENSVIVHPAFDALPHAVPQVSPTQLYGIEWDSFAYELASAVVWIGYIQWHQRNRYMSQLKARSPILQKLDQNILHQDAILGVRADGTLYDPEWPEANVIVGNPPFLGGKKMRPELGSRYVNNLYELFEGRIPRKSDLVTYWFERARSQIEMGKVKRVGLIATQGIRGSMNRAVLDAIKRTGNIFFAYSDRDWILDGASVHVSMIGFDNGEEDTRILDDQLVQEIFSNLGSQIDLTLAKALPENAGIASQGTNKRGAFDISSDTAQRMLNQPLNPNGRPNSDVVKRWMNGLDITRRNRNFWIIDFGTNTSLEDASQYEMPFEYLKKHVKSFRKSTHQQSSRDLWWLHWQPKPELRQALTGFARYLVTPRVAKYRIFKWLNIDVLPDVQLVAFAREDDYFFGVLHSRVHEIWALRQGTQLREKESGNRYTPTTTFETFPFPWSPGYEPINDSYYGAISAAAKMLDEKREVWLNPPPPAQLKDEWGGEYPPIDIKVRTLTNLYNQKPEWLRILHEKLDRAVFAAYRWEYPLDDEEILRRLLALNLERAAQIGE